MPRHKRTCYILYGGPVYAARARRQPHPQSGDSAGHATRIGQLGATRQEVTPLFPVRLQTAPSVSDVCIVHSRVSGPFAECNFSVVRVCRLSSPPYSAVLIRAISDGDGNQQIYHWGPFTPGRFSLVVAARQPRDDVALAWPGAAGAYFKAHFKAYLVLLLAGRPLRTVWQQCTV